MSKEAKEEYINLVISMDGKSKSDNMSNLLSFYSLHIKSLSQEEKLIMLEVLQSNLSSNEKDLLSIILKKNK